MRILIVFLFVSSLFGQNTEQSMALKTFEIRLENAVVTGDISFLEAAYAPDFVFTHGTGLVQNKESWLKDVKNARIYNPYTARTVIEQQTEFHDTIAITRGKTTISRRDSAPFWIKYIRVYATKDKAWQLVSHFTMEQGKLMP